MMIRALALLVVIAATVGGRPQGGEAAHASSDSLVLRTASLRLGNESHARVLQWVRQQPNVRRAGPGKDGRTLDIRFVDDREMLVLPGETGTVKVGRVARNLRPLARAGQSAGARAVVLEPFASELGLGPDPGTPVANSLRKVGFSVDEGIDAQVSVASMATLPSYAVTYMHTHSGVTQSGAGVVATGEPANGDPAVAPYLADGSVMVIGVAGTTAQYYGITSRFIAQHTPAFRSQSIVFINGCALLHTTDFWTALSGKGAGVLVSWTDDSTNSDNYLSGVAFFNVMQQNGSSVSEAIATLKQNGYGTSQYNGKTATLGSIGAGSITLAQAAASTSPPLSTSTPLPTTTSRPTATATAAPTATATVPPTVTSTPRPTATTTSTPRPTFTATPVPLSIVGLQTTVNAGKKQVFDVHGPAALSVSVHVAFPNGDAHDETVKLGADGTGHVEFMQPASSIMRRNDTATISVTPASGAGTTPASATYHIGFGRLDLAVQPRAISRGATAVLWVHARASVAVALQVQPLRKATDSFSVRTGPNGWAKTHYTVGHGRKRGNTLVVHAVITDGARHPETSTTLTVR